MASLCLFDGSLVLSPFSHVFEVKKYCNGVCVEEEKNHAYFDRVASDSPKKREGGDFSDHMGGSPCDHCGPVQNCYLEDPQSLVADPYEEPLTIALDLDPQTC